MSGQGGIGSVLPLILMIVAVWFLLVRPQQQRQKQQAAMLSQLEPGVEIVTIGGIFGTVIELGEERVRIAVADGSELEIARQAIRTLVTPTESTVASDEDDSTDEAEPPMADANEGDA